ncbi:TPA: hypothetical protein ACH3X1_011556 [Trebouxia sp. C0004]
MVTGRSPEQKRSKLSTPDFAGDATDADVLIPGNDAEPFDEPPPAPPDDEQPSDAAIVGDERGLIEDHEAAQYQSFSLQRSSDAHKLVFRQQDLPQQQTQSLSRSALELLPFLCEHSAEYANGLLRVLQDPSFDLASVHWTSSKEMHKCLDQAQVWEYLPVYQEELPGHDTPVSKSEAQESKLGMLNCCCCLPTRMQMAMIMMLHSSDGSRPLAGAQSMLQAAS